MPRPPRSTLFPSRRSSDLLVAAFLGQLTAAHRIVEQDLDVDLVVGGVHTGGVVDEVGVEQHAVLGCLDAALLRNRKSTRLNSSHMSISYAVFCLKKRR